MTDQDQSVQDPDEALTSRGEMARLVAAGDEETGAPAWAGDEPVADDPAAQGELVSDDLYAGLTSVGYLQAAVRRRAWFWCTLAVIGLVAGAGAVKFLPATYRASTSLLLSPPPNAALGWIQDDQAIAQSRAVAGIAIRHLGSHESPADLVKNYTALGVTTRVLAITVKATSAAAAVAEADALGHAFLTFRHHLLDAQQQMLEASLQGDVAQARTQVAAIDAQIARLSGQPSSPAVTARLATLQARHGQDVSALAVLKRTTNTYLANSRAATSAAIQGSNVLDPAVLLKQSVKRRIALFVGGGLVGGLAIGIGIVILAALTTDKLRRRDEIARALGAPVKLSVRKVTISRWRPGRRGLDAARGTNARRIVTHLGTAVTPGSGEPASLAVVPVGEQRVAALCLASLAVASAERGLRVVVADLCPGAPAARLLGAPKATGVLKVSVGELLLVVAVPDSGDIAPAGPLRRGRARAEEQLAAACASADLLLTMAALDPAVGADHLAGWAASAAALVTAGRSSAASIHAAGEMIRLSGMQQISAVLIGADKADQSLGFTRTHIPGRQPGPADPGVRVSAGGIFARVNGSRNGEALDGA